MSATNKTTHYELPQWIGTDKPTFLGDMNDAYSAIDTAIYNAATAASDAASAAGSAQSAAEGAQSTATSAANAASTAASTATTANTNAVAALNAIGTSTPLETTAQTCNAAINEVNAKDAGDIPFDDTGLSITANNVQDAIEALAAGGMTAESIRYDATTGYIQLKDSQGWFNWAKAERAIFDVIANSSVLQTMGYSTYDAPTVTPSANSVTITSASTNGLGWAYIPAQASPYTLHLAGNVTVNSPYSGSGREALHISTFDSISGGTSTGDTDLKTYSTTGAISDTLTIPAGKILGLTLDGVNNGGVTVTLTEFYGK